MSSTMKLKLHLYYNAFSIDSERFNDLEIEAETSDFDSDYKIRFKTVTVEIPDNLELTEKEYKDAFYFKHLSLAEQEVQKKRDELHRAEEVVKNMMAIEHNPQVTGE